MSDQPVVPPTQQPQSQPVVDTTVAPVTAPVAPPEPSVVPTQPDPNSPARNATHSVAGGQPTTHNSQLIENVVDQAVDIQDTFAQNDAAVPVQDDTANQQPSEDSTQPAGDAQKSPLDILEEILGQQNAGGDASKGEEPSTGSESPPAEPEKTPEELEAERLQQEALIQQEQAALEAQRQSMIAETQSEEQKQRDAIRTEQTQLNQSDEQHDIYQIKRERVSTQN